MGRIFCLVGLLVVGLAAAFPAEAVYGLHLPTDGLGPLSVVRKGPQHRTNHVSQVGDVLRM